jgi:hypothetical protein
MGLIWSAPSGGMLILDFFNLWEEVINIASPINFTNEEDKSVWQFQSSGLYSSHSLYRVINFRGVIPVFIPAIWKLIIPPRVQFFLWLLSKNKVLTRDNLGERRNVDDPPYLFCGEAESIFHLFFECAVAQRAWGVISLVFGVKVENDYASIAKMWLCNKKLEVCNMFTSAVCWTLWKLRNSLCLQDVAICALHGKRWCQCSDHGEF